ncbi:MAG TPA: hypothetical protein VHU23_00995 [Rhizomicrobium sp.]|nr:hypothetical protein [Rhizomicrobium sp.]
MEETLIYTPLKAAIERLGVEPEQALNRIATAHCDGAFKLCGQKFGLGEFEDIPDKLFADVFEFKDDRLGRPDHERYQDQTNSLGEKYPGGITWADQKYAVAWWSNVKVLTQLFEAWATSPSKEGHKPNRFRGPKSEAVRQAIKKLYPNGVPSPDMVLNVELCRAVTAQLKKDGVRAEISEDTIERVARRRK